MTVPSVAELRGMDLFEELTDVELEQWAQAAEIRAAASGTILAEQGVTATGVIFILDGTVEAIVSDGQGRGDEPVGDHVAPTWMGAINTLTGTPSGVRMIALTDLRMAVIAPERFVELAVAHLSVLRRVMRAVRPVVRKLTEIERNRERLASLGTMAAGLTHELNNPAAAATRAAADLADAVDVLSSTVAVLVAAGVEREQAGELVALQREAAAAATAAASGPPASALDAADAEDVLVDVLRRVGMDDAWRIAEPLAAAGIDEPFVARVTSSAGPATAAALRWIAASLAARELARQLSASTAQMSRLVGAVKTYAYMDRGAVVEVDLHEGLETTLTILGHKLKHTGILIVRDYDPDLPRVTVHGAELNQVWTNLLDNAIDALGESGTITLSTRRDGACIEVDIADDGPGIPDEIREHLFDPFFTTKGVGRGTGLGLDTARRIVVDRHRGSLTVDSHPGRTVFRTRLPTAG